MIPRSRRGPSALAPLVATLALAAIACAGAEEPTGGAGAGGASPEDGADGAGHSDGGGGSSTTHSTASASTGSGQDACSEMYPRVGPCQQAYWDERDGSCEIVTAADGALCSDGDDCSLGDSCLAGSCQKGPDIPSPDSCQTGIESITSMPAGSTILSFDSCTGGCSCCGAGGAYQDPISSACVTCSLDASLAANGITRVGGLGTYFVDCITGNADAPLAHTALFAAGASVELEFAEGVTILGFAALPSSGDSQPTVVLEGYSSDGVLVGTDSFDFLTPGGDCATSNPAARFFGFRACCGKIARAVVTFSDPNTAIDSISYF